MKKRIVTIIVFITVVSQLNSQVLIDDFQVNNSAFNLKGLGRPAIAANIDGGFAVAWQDFNENDAWVLEIPRVAVQLFSSNASPIGPMHLFRGEDRYKIYWNNNYLEPNPDIVFHPNGTLLVAVEHQGWFWVVVSENFSAEVGYGAVSSNGEMIDASGSAVEGNISWLYSANTTMEESPRICVTPAGNFFMAAHGVSYYSEKNAILIQQYDASGAVYGDLFTPHITDINPNFNHALPDIATNGELLIVVWQDSRQEDNWDISAQYFNASAAAVGSNFKINSGDPAGTINAWPSVDMNLNGRSVIVWADTRTSINGEIFGQIYDSNIQPVGDNFQVSSSQGKIVDRPELAILNDGSFMVVWTDSIMSAAGQDAYRARARQFNSNGTPTGDTFIIPNQDITSGLPNIGTDGTHYYLAWLDHRKGETHSNLFAKKISSDATPVTPNTQRIPTEIILYTPYPNPFNSSTTIRYFIPKLLNIQIVIYNIMGEKIKILRNEISEPGNYIIHLDATDLSSGVYFLRLIADDLAITKKLLITK